MIVQKQMNLPFQTASLVELTWTDWTHKSKQLTIAQNKKPLTANKGYCDTVARK